MAIVAAQLSDTPADPESTGTDHASMESRPPRHLALAGTQEQGLSSVRGTTEPPVPEPDPEPTSMTRIVSRRRRAARVASDPASPTHRRRERWFELNPGCFGRALLWAGGAAAGAATLGGLSLWGAWRLRRVVRVVRTGRAVWHGYRRVRAHLGAASADPSGSPRTRRGRARR